MNTKVYSVSVWDGPDGPEAQVSIVGLSADWEGPVYTGPSAALRAATDVLIILAGHPWPDGYTYPVEEVQFEDE